MGYLLKNVFTNCLKFYRNLANNSSDLIELLIV